MPYIVVKRNRAELPVEGRGNPKVFLTGSKSNPALSTSQQGDKDSRWAQRKMKLTLSTPFGFCILVLAGVLQTEVEEPELMSGEEEVPLEEKERKHAHRD